MKKQLFRSLTFIAILASISLSSCSIDDEPGGGGGGSTPAYNESGLPTKIDDNTIIYKTNDNIIVRFENLDVFGGAIPVSNTYSSKDGYCTIVFHSPVTAIDKEAFKNADNLVSIVLPKNVITIGYNAFDHCSKV